MCRTVGHDPTLCMHDEPVTTRLKEILHSKEPEARCPLNELRVCVKKAMQEQEKVKTEQARLMESKNEKQPDDSTLNLIEVFNVKVNVNLKAQTGEERLESRRNMVYDLYWSLQVEANYDKFCGSILVKKLHL